MIFKIESADVWDQAVKVGSYVGAPVDLVDGFIHFSSESQVAETLAKHFAGRVGLVLVAFDPATLGDALRWEPSRGGALFPHLYGSLDPALAIGARPIPDPHDLSVFADWGITA